MTRHRVAAHLARADGSWATAAIEARKCGPDGLLTGSICSHHPAARPLRLRGGPTGSSRTDHAQRLCSANSRGTTTPSRPAPVTTGTSSANRHARSSPTASRNTAVTGPDFPASLRPTRPELKPAHRVSYNDCGRLERLGIRLKRWRTVATRETSSSAPRRSELAQALTECRAEHSIRFKPLSSHVATRKSGVAQHATIAL